ncbi:DUF6683 family protein [Inquilinus sp. OTU3971]|uniref:DUF6683 family protein n=1 Tax=Inquilinus sp. OTU3971 TaxID=3043855 RepID=UPI00313BE46B
MTGRRWVLGALGGMVLAATAALAQDGGLPVLDLGPGILSDAGAGALHQSLVNRYGDGTRTAPGRNAASLTYTSGTALRRQAAADYVARIDDPEAAAAMRHQLEQHDYDRIYQGLTRPFGLAANDVADAMTAYTILGWIIVNGAGDPDPRSVKAARDQIALGLAANPALRSAADRARLGEEFKLLFVTIHAGWQAARREGTLAEYGAGVAELFATRSGLDLRRLRLTDRGLAGG